MYLLKKINKCVYTGEKYHILYSVEDDADLSFLYKNKEVDSLFDQDKFLADKKIRAFCNIHKDKGIIKTVDRRDYDIGDIVYHPSSVYVRKDLRGKGLGLELYKHMLSAIKMIHKDDNKYPLLIQHEQADNWATTCKASKKIYQKLCNESLLHKYDLNKEKYEYTDEEAYLTALSLVENGWYKVDISKVEKKEISFLRKRN